ncbi:MAG: alpha-amylase [Deltaproteobacteria bacterium]|nr:alpha-amylase [Deltaproteobacteria bacterium]
MSTHRSNASGLVLAITAGCVTPVYPGDLPLSDNVVDWRDEIIYQIVTDRFANGDFSNDYGANLYDPSAYHGGDWMGIVDRLDYLETLGVTALWISPVVKNVEADAGFASYHGYWTQDFTRTNPHFGDLSALRTLSDEAHRRGMKMILDIVTNHVGQAFYYDINQNGQPDEFGIGQGGEIVPLAQAEPTSDLVRISEWDPDFSAAGISSWTSLGPSGRAPVVFVADPEINRVPPYPELFAAPEAYHRKGRVTVWTNPAACHCPASGCAYDDPCRRQQELEGDFPGGLKDLDTRRQDVRDALFEIYARWIDVGDFDGFRIDTLKHVEPEFWNDFCPRIRKHAKERGKHNFFMFGEAFDGDDRLLSSYTHGDGVDGVFYFSQYYDVMRGQFSSDSPRTCEIERRHCNRFGCSADPCGEGGPIPALYDDTPRPDGLLGFDGRPLSARQVPVGFISNHDVGRFLFFMPTTWSQATKRQTLHLALTYLATMDGIPSFYYGVEQEFSGGNDPANRETLWDPQSYDEQVTEGGALVTRPKRYDENGDGSADAAWGPYDTGNPTFRLLQKLIGIRKGSAALRRGDLKFRWSSRAATGDDAGILAFERSTEAETVLVVLNLSPAQESHTRFGAATMAVSFAAGAEVQDLLDPASRFAVTPSGCQTAGGGCLDVTVPPRQARILVVRR